MPLTVICPARGKYTCLIYLTISIRAIVIIQVHKNIHNANMIEMPLKECGINFCISARSLKQKEIIDFLN